MRVATTKHGNRLHLIDPNTSDLKDTVTSCGRTKIKWTNIQRPVKRATLSDLCEDCPCQDDQTPEDQTRQTNGPGTWKTRKKKISPPGSSSQKKLKRAKAKGPPLTEGKTKHVRKGGTK